LFIAEWWHLLLGGNQMEKQMPIHVINVSGGKCAMRTIDHRIPD
jgi:hypothetical protein